MHRLKLVFVVVFFLLMGTVGLAAAQTVYVTDSFEITMRTGPSNGNKIGAMLPSGSRLEILEKAEGWYKVRSPAGKEGWVLQRFVSPDLPKEIVVDRLQRENARLKETAQKATERARELGATNKELSTSLSRTEKELSGTQQDFSSLRTDAQNVVELKKKYDGTSSQLKMVTAEKEKLATENQELRSESRMRWFLTGAGVVGGAWLFGFMMGRVQRRNRRGSLYS